MKVITFFISIVVCFGLNAQDQPSLRARDLGIPFEGQPGKLNAITDIPGVEVGHKTLIEGEGALVIGKGPIRTGVTVVLPKGKTRDYIAASLFSLNGDGELTGSHFINDYGHLPSAVIGITNTNSVGVVRDAIGEWHYKTFGKLRLEDFTFGLPVVGETWDGDFNDINGYHVKKEHVFEAIESAGTGVVAEGNVGGGTGMWLYGFKGGIGSSSRIVEIDSTLYTVGVLVQANFGAREELMVAGVPVGKEITNLQPVFNEPRGDGSIIVIVGTDAPLASIHLQMLARRVTLGLARTGATSKNGSGDIFLAFSTMEPASNLNSSLLTYKVLPKWKLDPLYSSTVYATEEAIINALIAAETMSGADNNIMYECPEERLIEILKKYNRIKD